MGSWFSNLSVKKTPTLCNKEISAYICSIMQERQYQRAKTADEADVSFAIYTSENTQWFTVYSDMFPVDMSDSFSEFARSMSETLGTDVLEISCFDSDYIFLHLINKRQNIDAWADSGRLDGVEIGRRTEMSAWQKHVLDFPHFVECFKKEYVFAEEILYDIAPCLVLPDMQSTAAFEILQETGMDKAASYLYFKLPAIPKTQEPPNLEQSSCSATPCFINQPSGVQAINTGGASKGLSVYFLGPYVEHEEIVFSEVGFVKRDKNGRTELEPFSLEKVQLSDGQWAYYYHNPALQIPPRVDDRLPPEKYLQEVYENEIVVRFVPQGNPRKILDITVVLVPDQNPLGQTAWNVWYSHGSKAKFIEQYNESWKGIPVDTAKTMLRVEDFD